MGLFFFQLPEPFVSQLPVGAILLPVQSSCTGSRTFNESRKHHKLNYFWGGAVTTKQYVFTNNNPPRVRFSVTPLLVMHFDSEYR